MIKYFLIAAMLAVPSMRETGVQMKEYERLIWDMQWGLHRYEVLIERLVEITREIKANEIYTRELLIKQIERCQ